MGDGWAGVRSVAVRQVVLREINLLVNERGCVMMHRDPRCVIRAREGELRDSMGDGWAGVRSVAIRQVVLREIKLISHETTCSRCLIS
ncbi:hypothetical protein NDU88_001460 [Pleurodeles waltl]|uniref:Uncharacterized protein n=1 Tax=Pleurodeles waltl TaxID=8319 RepID=A0AAV7R7B3_PLEWA|nr:hypothetical protein NDU88_001460 [Pleurodeles waltl]